MGKRFNQWLRMAANRGISVGTAAQAANTFHSGRAAAGKPQSKPQKAISKAKAQGVSDPATLLKISQAPNPTKAAQKGANKAAAVRGAIDSGVDPAVAGSLGGVKKVKNVQKKATAATAVAQAGGDANAQALAAMGGKKNQPVKTAKKVIKAQDTAVATAPPKRSSSAAPDRMIKYDQRPRKLEDEENLKIKKKSKRRRRALSRGTGQLRVAASGQTTNVPGKGGSGVNV